MSSQVHRSDELVTELEWLEFSDRLDISPASVWVLDYDEEMTPPGKRVVREEVEQLTADGIDDSSPSKATARPRILDESTVLPSEASFATVRLNQPIESIAVSERVSATHSVEELSANSPGRRPRILDDSTILPSEASFATVKLNQPIESIAVEERAPAIRVVEDLSVTPAQSRRYILDESEALPGEASFATVGLNEQTTAGSYSPLAEFFAKSDMNWTRLKLVLLLLVPIFAVVTLLVLKIQEDGLFRSPSMANRPLEISQSLQPPQPEPKPVGAELASAPSKSPGSVAASTTPEQAVGLATSKPFEVAEYRVSGKMAREPLTGTAETVGLRKTRDAKPEIHRRTSLQQAESSAARTLSGGNSNRQTATVQKGARPSLKEPVLARRKATASERVVVSNRRSENVVREPEMSPGAAINTAAGKPKTEPKIQPATGGGQRPRTVTPKNP